MDNGELGRVLVSGIGVDVLLVGRELEGTGLDGLAVDRGLDNCGCTDLSNSPSGVRSSA